MIRAVFLDLYKTIARFSPSREELQLAACRRFGIAVESKALARGYAIADAQLARQNIVRPLRIMQDSERLKFLAEYERTLLEESGVPVSLELAAQIYARLPKADYALALYQDTLPTLKSLKETGLILGVITNINSNPEHLLEQLKLNALVDLIVTSGEVGVAKPHAPIFRHALERAGTIAGESIHVGDQYEADVKGSQAVGIHPVLLDRDDVLGNYTDVPRITTLTELPRLVAELSAQR